MIFPFLIFSRFYFKSNSYNYSKYISPTLRFIQINNRSFKLRYRFEFIHSLILSTYQHPSSWVTFTVCVDISLPIVIITLVCLMLTQELKKKINACLLIYKYDLALTQEQRSQRSWNLRPQYRRTCSSSISFGALPIDTFKA